MSDKIIIIALVVAGVVCCCGIWGFTSIALRLIEKNTKIDTKQESKERKKILSKEQDDMMM